MGFFPVVIRMAVTWKGAGGGCKRAWEQRGCPSGRTSCPAACHTETNKAALCVKGEEKEGKKEGIALLGTDRQARLLLS